MENHEIAPKSLPTMSKLHVVEHMRRNQSKESNSSLKNFQLDIVDSGLKISREVIRRESRFEKLEEFRGERGYVTHV